MSSASLRMVEDAFHHALELTPAERDAYLAELREKDAALHAELAALLAVDADAGRRVQQAIDGSAAQLFTEVAEARVGRRLGAYELVELLGEGGMGSVYRAVRADAEYKRDVAIKVLRPGAASAHMVARLRDERQILAALDHPGIVRLLDGGSTDDGAPYLVLEYIEGPPITQYARTHALSVLARLELMLRVCDTVQYAHQRLVVHRDIKPSNVLVGEGGEPKLLDFGIAKLLDDGDVREAQTRTGLVPMTPAYASPEQVRGESVSTATDVYALGALLFELLTGKPSYEPATNPLETARMICEVVPPRASSVAPPELRSALAGDLDNIIAKALHKEPAQRYATVDAFAGDLRRHLEGRPVVARAPTLRYRARKFVRRHAGSLALGAVVVAMLVASSVWSLRQARRADREATRAAHGFAEGRKLAQTLVFEVEEQLGYVKGATALRKRILDVSLAYLDNLTAAATDDPSLARELALAYVKLGGIQGDLYSANTGQLDDARKSFDKAFALLDRMTAERDAPATLAVRITAELGLGMVYFALGDSARGTAHARLALARAAALPDDAQVAPEVRLRSYNALAFLPKAPAIAERDYAQMIAIATAWREREPASLEARYWLAMVHELHALGMTGDPVVAIADLRGIASELEELSRARPEDPRFIRDRAVVETSLAGVLAGTGNVQLWLASTGDVDGAIPWARAAVITMAAIADRDPHDVRLRSDLSGVRATLGALLLHRAPAEGVATLERALADLAPMSAEQRAEFYTRQNEWFLHCALPAGLARVGRGAEVDAVAARALAMAETIVNGMRGERTVAMCRFMISDARIALDQRAAAIELLQANVDELGTFVAEPDAPLSALIGLAESADRLATLRSADACSLARRANAAWRAWSRRTAYIERLQPERERIELAACATTGAADRK